MRHYYAILWHYGIASNSNGTRCAVYYRFASQSERDFWVADGPAYTTDRGYRAAIKSDDSETISAMRDGLMCETVK